MFSDGVKFIFKTLIKVPIIICIWYFVFNIFAFMFIYFKTLGVSYTVMQTAVENNYISEAEVDSIQDYLDTLNATPFVSYACVVTNAKKENGKYTYTLAYTFDPTGKQRSTEQSSAQNNDARLRRQYGKTVTCGVRCKYKIQWPLTYNETFSNYDRNNYKQGDIVNGIDGTGGSTIDSGTNNMKKLADSRHSVYLQDSSDSSTDTSSNSASAVGGMAFIYTVPGLHYYPDLNTN